MLLYFQLGSKMGEVVELSVLLWVITIMNLEPEKSWGSFSLLSLLCSRC